MTATLAIPLFPWLVDPPYSGRGRRPRTQAAVLAVVRARGPATVAEIAAVAGRSKANVRRCLRALDRAGLVVGAAEHAATRWRGSATVAG